MKVRIKYSEKVIYDQVVNMPADVAKKLINMQHDEKPGLADAIRDYLDIRDPIDWVPCDDIDAEIERVKK